MGDRLTAARARGPRARGHPAALRAPCDRRRGAGTPRVPPRRRGPEPVVELEVALAIRTAEEADELASWEPGGPDVDTVVDLLAWEDRRAAAPGSRTAARGVDRPA